MANISGEANAAREAGVMPRANVLSYVATVGTPTRVREVAARGLLIIGALYILLGLVGLGIFIYDAVVVLKEHLAAGIAITIEDVIWPMFTEEYGWFMLFIFAVTCGVAASVCAAPVGRGRREACYLANIILAPTVITVLLLTVGVAGCGISLGFGLGGQHAEPLALLLLPVAGAMIIAILLVRDLMTYLSWIGKNPVTEKPTVAFLPGMSGARDGFKGAVHGRG